MTDHGNVSGAIAFTNAMKKQGLKPIIGCEFYVCNDNPTIQKPENRSLSHLLLIATNLQGWYELIQITSTANEKEYFYYKPRLDLDTIYNLPHNNIIALTGHFGSTVTDFMYDEPKLATTAISLGAARGFLKTKMDFSVKAHLQKLKNIFGKKLFVEIQLVDAHNNHAAHLQAKTLRDCAKDLKIQTVATPDAHYANKTDASLQRILLCTALGNTTLADIRHRLNQKENIPLSAFFKTNTYHIPSYDEMISYGNTPEELAMSIEISNMCEPYELTAPPRLPQFNCPDGMMAMDYVRQLCKKGWESKKEDIKRVINEKGLSMEVYGDRFEKEFRVLNEAGLGDYFLIVHDFVNHARDNNILVGAGRGSAAGSLILYLLGVTHVDPLEYDLLFERFYNAGRNTKDRVSLPDVDMDFEKERRVDVIEYIKTKFGHDRVSQMITFNRMQGRSALKDVLRTRNACDYSEMNRITEHIPGEEEIADQLQDMRDADKLAGGDGEASILRWALENHEKEMKEWAYIDDDGKIQGDMGIFFEQAIALEGTKRSQGKHAAGIVISSEPLRKVCPMVYDSKTDNVIAGMEMNDLEAAGHVKFDILGVAMLDKIHGIQNLLSTRRL
jgi:DNA polymerase-3 subunit alpha